MIEMSDETNSEVRVETSTETSSSERPGVELLHEIVAAALAGAGEVLATHFTYETLTGKKRKYTSNN